MSIRSIARELGVSATAVSLALQNSPRVSDELRKRVWARAHEQGHVPNARLTELMREVRRGQKPGYRETLGTFSLFPEEEPWRERPLYWHLGPMIEGARACAESHGYRLENFWLTRPGLKPERSASILRARGIRALFCLGSWEVDAELPAALQDFAIVTQGASIPGRLHRVASHFSADARMLFDQLIERGYRRPGLCICVSGDRRTDRLYSATFLGYQEHAAERPLIPILRAETWDEHEFDRWLVSYRPDVVVIHQYEPYVQGIVDYLKKRRLRVPQNLGLAFLDKNPDTSLFSGICQDYARLGAISVEMLLGRLLLQDFRPPEHPRVELVVGNWNEGRTLRQPQK